MDHPFQCIEVVHRIDTPYLLSACGPKLSSTSLSTGEVVSTWTAPGSEDTGLRTEIPGPGKLEDDAEERPAKKQKTATSSATSLSKIIKLTASPDNRHAVAVTDDKCVRVFEIHDDGKLDELSQRVMPKRPCAVQVLPDNSTILCGDKFGDVYSLPLLPKPESSTHQPKSDGSQPPEEKSKPFKPQATTQTVHSKRNLKSLEAQMKQKNLTTKTKQPLAFEHKLLLGHVSVLTDLTYATREVDGKQRGYIITADRDEHIRVSRGPPQSHIIEGYCLGHTQFVSKVCAIPGADLLVSGGGDEWLGVWDWPNFSLRWKFESFGEDTRKALVQGGVTQAEALPATAVSGIWLVPGDLDGRPEGVVVVACERVPVLAYCPIAELRNALPGRTPKWSFEPFDHPVLDVTATGTTILLSFDTRSKSHERLRACKLHITRGECDVLSVGSVGEDTMQAAIKTANSTSSDVTDEKDLDSLLCGIANLRKRVNQDEAADHDEPAENEE
ncbi:tRNA (guanine-N(7)-)-methyltransferase non-catalytic subunit trm82 [Extremus antarcticus]|uniref:tRNA (Guanine-N(7)-)-methyltransferase non-catalytic subunit trm82 n=1 Tax=Extremus antarcticus TaxID=702011 RepID=A0AAJ0G5A2_9PEZI|nr:tRNA (guanine-N(7)-)-methyltransferase non-catalytic subunit trm82 [Extremus antarcticus]